MRANPPYADIYLQWREADFGRKALPGATITDDEGNIFYESAKIDNVLKYIKLAHNQRIADYAKGKK